MRKRGFTIVELIIVIAVIAILAAVLIPTFTSVVNKAHKTADQSTLHNLNMQLLAGDIDEEEIKKVTLQTKGWRLLYYKKGNTFVIVNNDDEIVASFNDSMNGTNIDEDHDNFIELEDLNGEISGNTTTTPDSGDEETGGGSGGSGEESGGGSESKPGGESGGEESGGESGKDPGETTKQWWETIEAEEALPEKDTAEYVALMQKTELNLSKVELESDYFNGNTVLERVYLGDITSVPARLFYGCTSLTEVVGKLQEIEKESFYNCGKLHSIDLSEVKTIGSNAFYKCSDLNGGNVSLPNIETIYDNSFNGATFTQLSMRACDVLKEYDGASMNPRITVADFRITGGEINPNYCAFVHAIITFEDGEKNNKNIKITVENISVVKGEKPFDNAKSGMQIFVDEESYNALLAAANVKIDEKLSNKEKEDLLAKVFGTAQVTKLWEEATP